MTKLRIITVLQVCLVTARCLQIPVYFDSTNEWHRNIQYHPEQPARIDACVKKLKNRPDVQLVNVAPDEESAAPSITKDDGDNILRVPFSAEELNHARDILLRTHSPELVTNLETRCRGSRQQRVEEGRDPLGFVGNIDEDTYVTTETYDVCLRATATWIRIVDHALGSSHLPSSPNPNMEQRPPTAAMALTRPPGHHATFQMSNGFCIFNFAAAAAVHAMESHPDCKISIFDWDVHYGQGVAKCMASKERARYVSIHQSPAFPYLAGKFGTKGDYNNIMNIPIAADTTWSCGYREKFQEHVLPFLRSDDWEPDLVLICAGYDALDSDELASVGLTAKDFYQMAKELKSHLHSKASNGSKGVPLVLGLEGGYQLSDMAGGGNLADAVAATLDALSEQ